MLKRLLTLAAIAALTALSGCATLNSLTATQTVVANQVLTLGAELYIQQAGGTATPPVLYSPQQQARAQTVYNDAAEISGFATGTITLAQLDSALNAWVLGGKTPLDQSARAALVAAVNTVLATRVTTGVLNAAATALVTEVTADWQAAAVAYGAVAGAATPPTAGILTVPTGVAFTVVPILSPSEIF